MSETTMKEELDPASEAFVPHKQPFTCSTGSLDSYTCRLCGYATHLRVIFAIHNHNSNEAPPEVTLTKYTCPKCTTFETFSFLLLMLHRKACFSTKNITYQLCDQCGDRIEKFQMKTHKLVHHTSLEEVMWFQCDYCSYRTSERQSFQTHTYEKHNESQGIPLTNCAYEIRDSVLEWRCFQTHTEEEHVDESQNISCTSDVCEIPDSASVEADVEFVQFEGNVKRKTFYCGHCDFVTDEKHTIDTHVSVMHPQSDDDVCLRCGHCNFMTKIAYKLIKHIKQRHLKDVPWLECGQCSYKTRIELYLKRHIKNCTFWHG